MLLYPVSYLMFWKMTWRSECTVFWRSRCMTRNSILYRSTSVASAFSIRFRSFQDVGMSVWNIAMKAKAPAIKSISLAILARRRSERCNWTLVWIVAKSAARSSTALTSRSCLCIQASNGILASDLMFCKWTLNVHSSKCRKESNQIMRRSQAIVLKLI